MFDSLKGMAGLGNLMKDLPRMKERLERAKAELADMTTEAEVGGGAVVAVAEASSAWASICSTRSPPSFAPSVVAPPVAASKASTSRTAARWSIVFADAGTSPP